MKAIRLLSIVFLIAFSFISYAQLKVVSKDLRLTDILRMGNNGLLLEASPNFSSTVLTKGGFSSGGGKNEKTYMYLNAEGKIEWEKTITDNEKGSYTFLVASPTGNVAFIAEWKSFPGKEIYVTQINKNGEIKRSTLESNSSYGKSLLSVFCDDEYLYLLATENNNEKSHNKQATERLILNRFKSSTLAYSRVLVAAPAVSAGESTIFWNYVGNIENEIYLVSKEINLEDALNVYRIAAINSDGKLIRETKINHRLANYKFQRAAWDLLVNRSIFSNLDVNVYEDASGTSIANPTSLPQSNMGSYTWQLPEMRYGSFGLIQFDNYNKCFYIYGLSGPKAYQRLAAKYEGFYVNKFDMSGKQVWAIEQQVPEALMEEKYFYVHGLPSERDVALKVWSDKFINFSIACKNVLIDFEIVDGKVVSTRQGEVKKMTDLYYNKVTPLLSTEFIADGLKEKENMKLKELYLRNLPLGEGEVVTRHHGVSFDLFYFKK